MKKQRNAFILKIMVIHVITYCLCGFLFLFLFNYQSTMTSVGMRDTSSLIVGLSPLFQIIRGLLFGIVLWILKDSFVGKRYGWLIVWLVIAVIGIINTPAPSPCSIEYFIYYEPSVEAVNLEIGGTLEIFTQTFLFSVLSYYVVRSVGFESCAEKESK